MSKVPAFELVETKTDVTARSFTWMPKERECGSGLSER
jgi:hypothetical protein